MNSHVKWKYPDAEVITYEVGESHTEQDSVTPGRPYDPADPNEMSQRIIKQDQVQRFVWRRLVKQRHRRGHNRPRVTHQGQLVHLAIHTSYAVIYRNAGMQYT